MNLRLFITLAVFLSTSITAITVEHISLNVGQTHRIELRANPTTGFSWYPAKELLKNAAIAIVNQGHTPDKTGLIGSGGTQFWEIKGKKPGTYTLILEYKRPWEKTAKPAEVKKFVITVK